VHVIPALAHQISRGEALIHDAKMVGDAQDHRLWQMRRATWVSHTVDALAPIFDATTLNRFAMTVARYVGGEHFESLPIELENLRDGLAMLNRPSDQ